MDGRARDHGPEGAPAVTSTQEKPDFDKNKEALAYAYAVRAVRSSLVFSATDALSKAKTDG